MNPDQHNESRAQYWQQQIEAWSQTELTGAKFCESEGLVYHQFVYWRRKLLEPSKPKSKTKTSPSNGFSQVSVQSVESSGLTLSFPNGIVVRGIDASNIAVIQMLLSGTL